MDKTNVIRLAIDMIQNKVSDKFSDIHKNEQALREAFIELNGGKSTLDFKSFRNNPELYEIIEEIVPTMVLEGLRGDEFFMNLVDQRIIGVGDEQDFYVEDRSELIVADASYGVGGIRRQRLGVGQHYTVETTLKTIKVYDELKRFMAGRISFDDLVRKVSEAMIKRLRQDIYNAFDGVTQSTLGLAPEYCYTGGFNERQILEVLDHLTAATGKQPIIFGTKMALRQFLDNSEPAHLSDSAKEDVYNTGLVRKWYGITLVEVPQRHKVGTNDFIMNEDKVYAIAGDDKPLKVINAGTGMFHIDNPLVNPDHTQNIYYGQEFGVAALFAQPIGIIDLG